MILDALHPIWLRSLLICQSIAKNRLTQGVGGEIVLSALVALTEGMEVESEFGRVPGTRRFGLRGGRRGGLSSCF